MPRLIGSSTCYRATLALAGVAILALALILAPELRAQETDLQSLPDLELVSGVEPEVLEVLREHRQRVDELVAQGGTSPADLAAAYGQLGRAALYFQLFDLAEISLGNAQGLDPDTYRWPYYLGAFYQDERRLEEARVALERAYQLAPQELTIAVRLGQVAELLGQPEEARRYFEAARDDDALAAVTLYGLGRAAAATGDPAAAAELFEAALERQPEAAEIHQQLGLAYRQLRNMDLARKYLAAEVSGELSFPDPLMDGLKGEFSRSHVFAGMEAEQTGRYDVAVAEYRKAVEGSPDNSVYRQALASALVGLGDLDAAVDEHRTVLELTPNDALAHILLAEVLVKQNEMSDEALEHFRRAAELAPELKEARLALGAALVKSGQLEEAESHYAAALDIDPDDDRARLAWARLLIHLGREAEAIPDLERILATQPDNPEALLSYGLALARTGQSDTATEVLGRVLEMETTATTAATAHAELAEMFEAMGAFDQALEHFELAAELVPEYKPPQLGLARALIRAGRPEEAVAAYDLILVLDPADEEARLGRARALLAAGRESEVATELQAVLELNPGSMEALLDLATLEARQGDLEGAIGRLTAALDAAETPEARALLSFQVAGLWQARGDDQRAIEYYTRTLEDFPDFKDAHFNLAVALGRQGRIDEATAHLTRVVELDPTDDQAHLALAQAFASQGRFADSRGALETGLRDLPDSLILSSALAQLLLASPDEAVRDAVAAIPLAMRVFEAQPSTGNAATVAAALGAAGRFSEAADWQGRVVSEAEKAGLPAAQLERMRADLEAYRQRAGSGP